MAGFDRKKILFKKSEKYIYLIKYNEYKS